MTISSADSEAYATTGIDQESYRLMFENNPLPMWVFDTDSLRFLMVNNSAVSLYGYSKEEFLQMTIKDIRQPETWPALYRSLNSHKNDLNKAGEWAHLKKDGSVLFVDVCSHALPSEKGVSKRLVVLNDITSRKEAELQLREAESHAQSILNNIVEIVFSFNEKMQLTYVSPQCLPILGFSQEQFYQDTLLWFNLVYPEDRAIFVATLPKIKASNDQFQLEYRSRTATGKEKWMIARCTAQLTSDGQMIRIDGSAHDITDRKQAEERLKFADFSIERAPDAFLWTKEDAQIMRVNKAACVLLGYQEEELLQMKVFDIDPAFSAEMWHNHWQAIKSTESMHFETILKAKDGKLHPVEIQLNHFAYGQENYSFTSIRPITERKQAEIEKAMLIEETGRQNEHLKQFAYIVSHNLRAPVANIVGLTSLYNRKNPADPVNSVLINKLECTSHRLDATIRDLNEILTIRSKAEQVLEVIDLHESFIDARESLAAQILNSKGEIFADFAEGTEVLGIKSYITSIFLNLISNAIKYREPKRNLEIHIKTVFSNGFLCLQFQDNGLGIDLAKQRHKIFGLYHRFHPHIEGKGIGLYMIKTQMETLGGWINVDSTVGVGSTFKAFFKRHQ